MTNLTPTTALGDLYAIKFPGGLFVAVADKSDEVDDMRALEDGDTFLVLDDPLFHVVKQNPAKRGLTVLTSSGTLAVIYMGCLGRDRSHFPHNEPTSRLMINLNWIERL